jgi:hypothetical protein
MLSAAREGFYCSVRLPPTCYDKAPKALQGESGTTNWAAWRGPKQKTPCQWQSIGFGVGFRRRCLPPAHKLRPIG